jgi:hypothetical protein
MHRVDAPGPSRPLSRCLRVGPKYSIRGSEPINWDPHGAAADDVNARVAATALMGVQRTLIDYVRTRVLADDRPERLATDVRRLGRRAFKLLAAGLGDYAAKPASPADTSTPQASKKGKTDA